METVLVKLVVFKSSSEDLFFSYCPATHDFASKGKTVEETANSAKKWLLQLLENRIAYKNSRIMAGKYLKIQQFPLYLQIWNL